MTPLMTIKKDLLRSAMAAATWFALWALIGGGLAIGIEGGPANPAMGLRVVYYGAGTGVLFGVLVFFSWGQTFPLWLRGAVYGLLAALVVLLIVIAFWGAKS